MKTKHIYICEDSATGIFTGIYDAWASNYGHTNNELVVGEPANYELFAEMIYVEPDVEKAAKVSKSIYKKISSEAYRMVYYTALSYHERKADYIYRFLILGFSMGSKILECLTNEYVDAVTKLSFRVHRENGKYEGFLRFNRVKQDILFARFRPQNNIVSLLADFFADRFPDECWIICDEGRKLAAVHEANKPWYLYQNYVIPEGANLEEEDEFFRLWKCVVDTIGIKERNNKKLQYQMMPNRYREFIQEVDKK